MGELKEAKSRWSRKMPKFFRIIMWVCGFVSGTALAVNTAIMAAGAQPHDWWVNIFPHQAFLQEPCLPVSSRSAEECLTIE